MRATSLLELTANDMMTRDVVRLTTDMPMWEAACLLLNNQVGGAPVVDEQGRCVGTLSTLDFVRLAAQRDPPAKTTTVRLPNTCAFQIKHRTRDVQEATLCDLPLGACPLQVEQDGPDKQVRITCSQPTGQDRGQVPQWRSDANHPQDGSKQEAKSRCERRLTNPLSGWAPTIREAQPHPRLSQQRHRMG